VVSAKDARDWARTGLRGIGNSSYTGVRLLIHDEGNGDKAITTRSAVFEMVD
jgi:hypothetical protein